MNQQLKNSWLDGIDGEAVPMLIMSEACLIRVVAGPGSGKTTGLKRRVQRLIQRDGVQADKIFVGTFTRTVTRELAKELGLSSAISTRLDDRWPAWVSFPQALLTS